VPSASTTPVRHDGRAPGDLRTVRITPGFVPTAHGSALIEMGGTRVICTATVEESVPGWRRGQGAGWVTAEYGMLPASTGERRTRDVTRGKLDGRSSEIQRLIGRAVRAVIDMEALGERTVWLDCDVLTADAGTRCASICGAYVALEIAVRGLLADGRIARSPIRQGVAAVSVAIVGGVPVLDPDYTEDVAADADVNVVMTAGGELIEVQATAEREAFSRAAMDEILDLAGAGIGRLLEAQSAAVASA